MTRRNLFRHGPLVRTLCLVSQAHAKVLRQMFPEQAADIDRDRQPFREFKHDARPSFGGFYAWCPPRQAMTEAAAASPFSRLEWDGPRPEGL